MTIKDTLKNVALMIFLVNSVVRAGEPGITPELEHSRSTIKTFGSQLLTELTTAIAEGGPVNAIDVCRLKAPEVSAELMQDTGVRVGRTALKIRNPANSPDNWEWSVLNRFEESKDAGADMTELEYSEFIEKDAGTVFRYMKAIPTGTLCLTCHGENVSADIKTKLNELYPQDMATGFREGDIRGAFTVIISSGVGPQ